MILIVGDVMLDVYIHGVAVRTTRESGRDVAVFEEAHRAYAPGGAANAAACVRGLGAKAVLVSVVGDDGVWVRVRSMLDCRMSLLHDQARPTTVKTRYYSDSGHVFRVDRESRAPLHPDLRDEVARMARRLVPDAAAVLLSDYGKGVVTPEVSRAVIDAARERGVPVVVDPKGRDWSRYRGATLITPNVAELDAATVDWDGVAFHDVDTEKAYGAMRETVAAVLVTRGAQGMTLFQRGEVDNGRDFSVRVCRFDAHPVLRAHPIGAGDTVAATCAVALAEGYELERAAEFANAAAACAVGKPGTATASREEVDRLLMDARARGAAR